MSLVSHFLQQGPPDPEFISGFRITARLGFVQKDALRGYWAGVIMVGDEWKPPGASHP